MKLSRSLIACIGGLTLFGFQSQALAGMGAGMGAGAVIVYAPLSASAIPTLSEWGVGGLALMMAVIAYRYLRVNVKGSHIASLFVAALIGYSALSGGKFVSKALAILQGMTLAGGGSVRICGNAVQVPNSTPVTLVITRVDPDPPSSVIAGGTTCTPNTTVQSGQNCTLNLTGSSNACSPL